VLRMQAVPLNAVAQNTTEKQFMSHQGTEDYGISQHMPRHVQVCVDSTNQLTTTAHPGAPIGWRDRMTYAQQKRRDLNGQFVVSLD
jgi:hypothetical protein